MNKIEQIAGTTFERKGELKGRVAKVKIGVTIPVSTLLFMEILEQHGYSAGRSDFVSQAVTFYMAYLMERFHLSELIGEEVRNFKGYYPDESDALEFFKFASSPKS